MRTNPSDSWTRRRCAFFACCLTLVALVPGGIAVAGLDQQSASVTWNDGDAHVQVSQVSGPSPFGENPSCSQADAAAGNDTPGLDVGPVFAATKRHQLIAAWAQDSGAGIVAAHADSYGSGSWTQQVVHPVDDVCGNGVNPLPFAGAGPIVVTGAGRALLLYGPSNGSPLEPFFAGLSDDNGATWTNSPEPVIPPGPPTYASMAADPRTDRFHVKDASVVYEHIGLKSQMYLTQTTDNGETWSAPSPIPFVDPNAPDDASAFSLTILPDGTLVIVAWTVPIDDAQLVGGHVTIDPNACGRNAAGLPLPDETPCRTDIHALVSTDGLTWTDHPIATLDDMNFMNDSDNEPPAAAVGPDASVNVLIPLNDNADGVATWKIYRSTDDGFTWKPLTASDGKDVVVPVGSDKFWSTGSRGVPTGPSFAVGSDGAIAVLYTNHGAEQAQPGCPDLSQPCTTDVWMTYSRNGRNWHRLHLAGPYDNNLVGSWSDYVDMHAMDDGGFGAAFSIGRCMGSPKPPARCIGPTSSTEDPTDVFFAHITFNPQK